MTARILCGREVALGVQKDLKLRIRNLKAEGIKPLLSIVSVGKDASSKSYIRGIEKAGKVLGIGTSLDYFPPNTKEVDLKGHLDALNCQPRVHGIIVMRPLPPNIREDALAAVLAPQKVLDCFSPLNAGRFMAGDQGAFPPATPQAVLEILKHYDIPLVGRQAVVIGRSMVVGRPLAMLLLNQDATVNICHSHTTDLPTVCRRADILVAAAGQRHLVTGNMVKPGAVVIDVGINFTAGKICGDVDYDAVCQTAGAITPVPGGVGTVTSFVVLKHLVEAAEKTRSMGINPTGI